MKEFNLTQDTINEKVTDILKGLSTEHTEISEYITFEDIEDFDNVFDTITDAVNENNNFDVDVIYYSRAIEYLQQNDASLSECMRIASEMGYITENINSELLASLLASENNRDEWSEKADEVNGLFEDLAQEIEDYKTDTIDYLVRVGENESELTDFSIDELTELANDLIDKIQELDE